MARKHPLQTMSTSRTSLRKIAEQTGVTRMAVSLALRGKPGVSESTRKNVLRVASRLGYEPDPELAKLLTHIRMRTRSETKASLALLTSGPHRAAWQQSVTERKYVEGAQARAKEYGYRLDEFWMNEPGMSLARLGNIIWSRGIEGVIIAPLQGKLSETESRTLDFDFAPFSSVEISETVEQPDLGRAIHDQYTSMLKVLAELTKANYRKIGLVLEAALDQRVNGKWTAAYLYFRQVHGGKSLSRPLLLDAPNQRAFDKWFDCHHPDAIISVDRLALRLLERRGVAIPREVGYATLDLDEHDAGHQRVSGIDQNSRLVGAAAVDMLVAAIQRGERGLPKQPLRTEIEGTWVAGKTTLRMRPARK